MINGISLESIKETIPWNAVAGKIHCIFLDATLLIMSLISCYYCYSKHTLRSFLSIFVSFLESHQHYSNLHFYLCRLWVEIEAHKWRFLALLVDHILSEVRPATKELSAVLSTYTQYWANILVEGRCIKISSQIDRWIFGGTSVLSW